VRLGFFQIGFTKMKCFQELVLSSLVLAQGNVAVGVKPGDWVEYAITKEGTPPIWGTMPVELASKARVEVTSCSGMEVDITATYYIPNGEKATETYSINLTNPRLGDIIIPANISSGTQIDTFKKAPVFINGTFLKCYGGAHREVNFVNISFHRTMYGHPLKCSLELYWDKQTGFLLEKIFTMTPLEVGNPSTFKWKWQIIDTNLFEFKKTAKNSPIQWSLIGISGLIGTTMLGVIFIVRSNKRR